MTDQTDVAQFPAATSPSRFTRAVLGRFAKQFETSPVSFSVTLPDGSVQPFGPAAARFNIVLKNSRALKAVASLDEGRFGDAYVNGDIDLEGDMLSPFELRGSMKDIHPLTTIWRFLQPLLFGQVHTNRQAITAHYDIDPEFFLSFLDPATPCYTQGVYLDPSESLEAATLRKFDYCFQQCGLKRGDEILEIGPGWGAWFEYASRRGVKCTGITISETSKRYLESRAKALGFDWNVLICDLLEYKPDRQFDSIIIMGVIEHLPDYASVLAKFEKLLKPGGRIFLDGSACIKKFELSSFMVKYIYGGNHSFLVLHDFLEKLARTKFEVTEIFNDRESYFLTFQQWARNFDANRDIVVQRFGDFNYRRFRLYLWGAAYEFLSRSLDCYRMVIQSPAAQG
jgi:cyclopropane-fatty-acyl-phospholipid synthase